MVSLWDERRSYASYIYEPVKLDATKVLLSSREWDESDLFSMMEEYFALLKGSTAQDESEYFLNAMKNFFFSGDDLEETNGRSANFAWWKKPARKSMYL